MKRVLVLAAAVLLISGTGFATITGSSHDFQADGWNPGGEICQPCHTPHNGSLTVDPLWNHDVSGAAWTPYADGNGTLDATVNAPAAGSVTALCLSCHDGTVGLGAFGGATDIVNFVTGAALVGTDLTNDHPVAFTYDTALATLDGELANPSVVLSGLAGGGTIAADMLFSDSLECASCHDVHDFYNLSGLLLKSNAASALCLTCHTK
jgi:predicted CXXCH cytochrome family protein